MLIEQAIHESLINARAPANEDQEFERMIAQVMKDSKQDHDIQLRKEKEEELHMIFQIPELRQQKIEEILNC